MERNKKREKEKGEGLVSASSLDERMTYPRTQTSRSFTQSRTQGLNVYIRERQRHKRSLSKKGE